MIKRKGLKRFISYFLLLFMVAIWFPSDISAADIDRNTFKIKGVTYYNQLTPVIRDEDFNSSLQVNELTFFDGKLGFLGKLKTNYGSYDFSTEGVTYMSQSTLNKANAIIVDLKPSAQFKFLCCSIERNAKQELLLPANKYMKNSYVIKLAIKDINNNKVIYFEDYMKSSISFEVLEAQTNKVTEEVKERLGDMENWYIPYFPRYTLKEDTEEVGKAVDRIAGSLKKIYSDETMLTVDREIYAASPVYGVPISIFTSPGSSTYTGNDRFGYYRTTTEWPIGSGNMLTRFIKWNTVADIPVVNGVNRFVSLRIEDEAQYLYYKADDVIILLDKDSQMRINNSPSIQFTLMTMNSDIITHIKKNVISDCSATVVDWKNWMGLIPYTSNFITPNDAASSINLKEDLDISSTSTFYDTLVSSMAVWGNVNRSYKLTLPSYKYLQREGDMMELTVGIRKPMDAANYYSYQVGPKMAGFRFSFSVYSHNGWASYNVKECEVIKDITRMYDGSGWAQIDKIWYYSDNMGVIATGWKYVDGNWYYFNSSGQMQTGWQQIGGTWYYLMRGGQMVTGWQHIGSDWYCFNTRGSMLNGWQNLGGIWYYLKDSGQMVTGWRYIGADWYYFDKSGHMLTGWQSIGGVWYYFKSGGQMVIGWQAINGRAYYFNSSGVWIP